MNVNAIEDLISDEELSERISESEIIIDSSENEIKIGDYKIPVLYERLLKDKRFIEYKDLILI